MLKNPQPSLCCFISFPSSKSLVHRLCLSFLTLFNWCTTLLRSVSHPRYFTLWIHHGRSVLLGSTSTCRCRVFGLSKPQLNNFHCGASDQVSVRLRKLKQRKGPLINEQLLWSSSLLGEELSSSNGYHKRKSQCQGLCTCTNDIFGKFKINARIKINLSHGKIHRMVWTIVYCPRENK